MRIVFAGTPEVAVPTLRALVDSGHTVVGVMTRPPKRQGRRRTPVASPVAQAAADLGLRLLETEQPGGPEALDWLQGLHPDLGVVVAYGALLSQQVLDVPDEGWLNVHFSALPHLRGAAPVQRAIMRGDTEIGVSIFRLDAGLDTGPLLLTSDFPLPAGVTSGQMLQQLSAEGAGLLVEAVNLVAAGQAQYVPQDEGPEGTAVTYAPKLERKDGFIDFRAQAPVVDSVIRGVTPAPGAWTTLPGGHPMKLGAPAQVSVEPNPDSDLKPGQVRLSGDSVTVGCQGGTLVLGTVAPAGKKWMEAAAWARGAQLTDDFRLGLDHGA